MGHAEEAKKAEKRAAQRRRVIHGILCLFSALIVIVATAFFVKRQSSCIVGNKYLEDAKKMNEKGDFEGARRARGLAARAFEENVGACGRTQELKDLGLSVV